MAQSTWIRWSGLAGLVVVVLYLVGTLLFLAAGAPPGLADSSRFAAYAHTNSALLIAIGLVYSLAFAVALLFSLGLRDLIRTAGPSYTIAGNLFLLASVVALTIAALGSTLLIATGVDASGSPEPVAVRGLFEGASIAYASGGALFVALFLATAAWAVGRSGVLPRWTAWIGWAAAVLNVASVPAAFGGSDPGGFYTATGFAGLLMGLLPLAIWTLVTAIAMVRTATRTRTPVGTGQ